MDDVVDKVVAEQRRVGETVQPPASDGQVAAEADSLRTRFGAVLPDGYARLLRRVNGVDFDGVVLYGAGQTRGAPGAGGFWQGLAEANAHWRDGPGHDDHLVLGETDIDLLTVELDGRRPVLRDKVSNEVNEEFGSIDDAVDRMLGARL